MYKIIQFIAATTTFFMISGCGTETARDQQSKKLAADSVINDTTTIQYRDTSSSESRGEIPPTPEPVDTSSKK
ncbi:hypothetical protein HX021_15415 [Sphingobacterium sp. N143]|uniref:hypothetical protein n=1 Tax=Sphingobacterium sp. N143 TaxID=2746727 RepID=UPI002576E343|nr:hypothetical protein [Sphingobacterium sp. N143]MDM1295679.1 hypothetical protein [Sphingobacterium sp. N143]